MGHRPNQNDDILSDIFSRAYEDITGNRISADARFYRYSGIKSTIRLEGGVLKVKVSDMLDDAPRKVLFSLARILACKLERNRPRKTDVKIYRLWINSDEMDRRHMEAKKARGRKARHAPRGDFFDLESLFCKINEEYLEGILAMPTLYWGKRLTKRKYGHYDSSKHAILISKSLDSKEVPRYVVEYVLYHEMLHIIHGSRKTNTRSRSVHHHKDFRDAEKEFRRYDDAERFLKMLSLKNSSIYHASKKMKNIKKRGFLSWLVG